MLNFGNIHFNIVDTQIERACELQQQLTTAGHDATIFEKTIDCVANWPLGTVILAEDNGAAIRSLLVGLKQMGCLVPVIAYSQAPAANRIVYAIMDGAADYMRMPACVADIEMVCAQALARRRNCASQMFGERAMLLIQEVTTGTAAPSLQ